MTYIPVIEEKEISKYHNLFREKMKKYATNKVKIRLGFKGKESDYFDIVTYSKDLNIWWNMAELDNRFCNVFGIDKPHPKQNTTIRCEINYPYDGLDLRIAALFVKNKNEVILAHSGKIGGGRKGIGKSLFVQHYKEEDYIDVEINGKIKKYAPIAELTSPRFALNVAYFVNLINQIKSLNTTTLPLNSIPDIKTEFNEEFFGKKKVSKGQSTHICDHGLIVRTLKDRLEEKGFKVANDKNRDLYTFDKKRNITLLFEIKTDLLSQSIYKAIGQLYMNSILLKSKPMNIIVVPVGMKNKAKNALRLLEIETLDYIWKNNKPVFPNLSKLF